VASLRLMCSRARCRTCGLTTWSGCGAHVDRVMRGVPADERCTCPGSAAPPRRGGGTATRRSLLALLRGG